jgi:hypothetical protein
LGNALTHWETLIILNVLSALLVINHSLEERSLNTKESPTAKLTTTICLLLVALFASSLLLINASMQLVTNTIQLASIVRAVAPRCWAKPSVKMREKYFALLASKPDNNDTVTQTK